MSRRIVIIAAAPMTLIAALWAWNASLFAPRSEEGLKLIAHRGVHHTYSLTNKAILMKK